MITPSFAITATERVLPRLALDFTTASLDPRVTFARATNASNPATYVNSSGLVVLATNDQPRFDFNPVTLDCRGLLIEESRTNNIIQSNDFTGYILSNTNVVLTSGTSPDGTNNANKINELATTTTHFIRRDVTLGNGAYTVSIYAKAAERTAFALQLADGVAGGAAWKFNLSTGQSVQDNSISAGSWTNISGTITDAGNGFYRCTLTATKGAGTIVSSRVHTLISYASGSTVSYLGVVDHGILAYGLQLESGFFATSYIPTTTTALTRNADVSTMTGTDFSDWYSVGAGGLAALVLPSTVSGTRPAIQFDDNTTDEIIALRGDTTNPELVIVEGGAGQAQIDAGTIAANTAYNLGAAWATDDCAAAVNGGAAVTDTTATIPTVTQARLGSDGTNYLNGHLQSIRYWPQRIIDAEVRAFSK